MMWWRRRHADRDALDRAIRADMEAGVRLQHVRQQGTEIRQVTGRLRDARLRNHYGEAVAASFTPRRRPRRWLS